MKIILLSGGSGKRLWPLSNDSRSKQFLKVLQNEYGTQESMIQRVWRQLKTYDLTESTFIATSKAQVDIIQNQLGDEVPLIVEPERRDTFPAIALASSYLYSSLNINSNEVICVLPVDMYVENSFFEVIKTLEPVLEKSSASLVLIGASPSYPSEQYGYIVPTQNHSMDFKNDIYKSVKRFVEKPNLEKAKNLIEQRALWNCGVFAFRLGDIIKNLLDKGISIQYSNLLEQYSKLPKKSFDYEIVEKIDRIVVVPYKGKWSDLGTWDSLTKEMDKGIIGRGVVDKKSSNNHLINELDIPIIVAGISNSVIITSPDGILIADKRVSGGIKEFVKHFAQRPLYEERRWGWYKVLDYQKLENGNEVLTKKIKISAGKNLSYQMHLKRKEVWIITSGEGELALDGVIKRIKIGDVIQIPVQMKHGAKAISDLEFIEVQMGSELIEEDIIRICLTWEEVERLVQLTNE